MTGFEDFHERCGKVLRIRAATEQHLEFLISNYFVTPQTEKTFFLTQIVISYLSLERKTRIFEEICKQQKIDNDIVRPIIASIENVRRKGNRVAHDEIYCDMSGDAKFWLQKKKQSITKTEMLEIDDNLVKELEQDLFHIAKGIANIYVKIK